MSEKPSFEDYIAKCVADLGFESEHAKAEGLYKINLAAARQTVLASDSLKGIIARLDEMRKRYARGNSDLLFYRTNLVSDLNFLQKPFLSTLHKLYRRNVLFNKNYPNPPVRGFIEIPRLYEEIDDLIRGRLICKYMDGPAFVCEELASYCSQAGVDCRTRNLSTDAGYYAWHFYFKVQVDLSVLNDLSPRNLWVELQLSTS